MFVTCIHSVNFLQVIGLTLLKAFKRWCVHSATSHAWIWVVSDIVSQPFYPTLIDAHILDCKHLGKSSLFIEGAQIQSLILPSYLSSHIYTHTLSLYVLWQVTVPATHSHGAQIVVLMRDALQRYSQSFLYWRRLKHQVSPFSLSWISCFTLICFLAYRQFDSTQ